MAIRMTGHIAELGLAQKQAAKALRVTQPRISDLVPGRIELFGIDTLVDMRSRFDVAVALNTRRRSRVAQRMSVQTADPAPARLSQPPID